MEKEANTIIDKIFSFLEENQKLVIIKYNKNLQTQLGINIKYYKRESGKEIVHEGNGKVKEYILGVNTKELFFEGQYINGRKNGNGKEYNNYGKTRFEGEYLYGKRWNGKGYNNEGNLEFEIINGCGKGKEYDFWTNTISFEGEYLNGERNGKGKEYYNNGILKYEGEYLTEKEMVKVENIILMKN